MRNILAPIIIDLNPALLIGFAIWPVNDGLM